MRNALLIIAGGLLLTGCAASQPATCVSQDQTVAPRYIPAATTALAFDPAIGAGRPLPQISRDDRGVSVATGYETETAEYFDIQTNDDFERDNYPSSYERDVISDKVGVIYH